MPRKRINWLLAGTLLSQGMTVKEVAEKVGSNSESSFAAMLSRKGMTSRQLRTQAVDKLTESLAPTLTQRVAKQASEMLRNDLSDELAETTAKLKTIRKQGNLKDLQKRVQVLEPLARTAKIVHGWADDQHDKPLVNVLTIGLLEPENLVTDTTTKQLSDAQPDNVIDVKPL